MTIATAFNNRFFFQIALILIPLSLANLAQAASLSAQIFDKEGKPMPEAIIYALPVNGNAPSAVANTNVQVLQEGMEYKPYVTVIQTGTSVNFINKDKHEHHIKSFGPAKEFEFKITDASKLPAVIFDKVGNSTIVCYLHGWMRAHIYAVDTPWFAKSDAQGQTKINNLPEGEYELKAWHPDTLAAPLSFKINTSQTTPLLIKFDHLPRKRKTPPTTTSVY